MSDKEINTIDAPIFTVTTIRHALHAGSRAVGYYHDFENADRAVRENVMDINECNYYPFAVIEYLKEGIYSFPRSEYWYKWNREKAQYEGCGNPERFQKIVCWSLG